jgi:hypothetical protein
MAGFQGTRLMGFAPDSYNADTRSVEAVLSAGSRSSATTSPKNWKSAPKRSTWAAPSPAWSRCWTRTTSTKPPPCSAPSNVRIENGQLLGTLTFGETDRAKEVEGMVARGELKGISIGYRVNTWTIVSPSKTATKPGARRAGNCWKSACFRSRRRERRGSRRRRANPWPAALKRTPI